MASIVSHGGHCCGVRHFFGFHLNDNEESIREQISRATVQHQTQGMLVEAVLTNRQCKELPRAVEGLQKNGFKLVSRFKNPNSGNICNVFHLNTSPRSLTTRLPFKILKDANV